MPRLFTGLEIPDELGDTIASLRGGLSGARWIDPENYHITLRFIGDIDERTANDVADMLSGIQRRTFQISIGGLGVFGKERPHSVYASILPSRELDELQNEHEKLIRRCGLPPEARKFTPHITLARLRNVAPWQVADWITERSLPKSLPFYVGQFVLFSSKASVGGGPYLVEEAYPLLAARAA